LQNELKHIGLYNGFQDDLFIVTTFRTDSRIGVGVTALQNQQWHEEARAMIDYMRLKTNDDCDTLEGAYIGQQGDIYVAF
jgi:hypothetical protein